MKQETEEFIRANKEVLNGEKGSDAYRILYAYICQPKVNKCDDVEEIAAVAVGFNLAIRQLQVERKFYILENSFYSKEMVN